MKNICDNMKKLTLASVIYNGSTAFKYWCRDGIGALKPVSGRSILSLNSDLTVIQFGPRGGKIAFTT